MKRNKNTNIYTQYGNGSGPVEIHIRNGSSAGYSAPTDYSTPTGYNAPQFNNQGGVSRFNGGLAGWIGIGLLMSIVIIFTLGLGTPWAVCMQERWYAKHTKIDGRQVVFDGKGIQLLGNYIKWFFLIIVTLGIYSMWVPLRMRAWVASHTHLA